MSFKRLTIPDVFPAGDALTSQLVSIGFRFAADPAKDEPNIEDCLIAASVEGLRGDLRTLGLLVDWVEVHMKQVNADRLSTILKRISEPRLSAFWGSIAKWKKSDSRFDKVYRLYRGPRIPLLDEEAMAFHLKRDGEDPRFHNTKLIIPNKVLRHRLDDIADIVTVAKSHLSYKHRLIIGPTYRADMWAALEREPQLSPSALARKCYGSFSTAWNVKKDWDIVRQAV